MIDANGMTLMPGLVEGHAHITFINGARPTDLGDTPPEEHTLLAARNAQDVAGPRLHQRLQRGDARSCGSTS